MSRPLQPKGRLGPLDGAARLRLADGILFTALVASPLLAGVVHLSTWLAVLAASWSALLLIVTAGPLETRPNGWIAALLVLTGAATLLPLVPLPPGLVAALSPTAAETWSLSGVLPPGAWRPLHQAPGEGRFELLKWLAVCLFLVACSLRAADDGWRRRAIRAVLFAGLLAGATAVAHQLLGAQRLFGIYTPRSGRPPSAPLLNENHWAAWLSMCATVAAGVAFVERRAGATSGSAVVAAVVMAGLVLLDRSRSGLLGLAASALVLAALLVDAARRSGRKLGVPQLLGIAASLGLGAVVTAGLLIRSSPTRIDSHSGAIVGGLDSGHRLPLLADAWRAILAQPWTGVGRGASVDLLPRFRHTPGTTLAYWVESLVPQLLLDHGLVLGGAITLTLIGGLLAGLGAARRHRRRAGAVAALCGLFVHEMADFSVFTGAVLLTGATLASVVLPGRRSDRPARGQIVLLVLAPVLLAVIAPNLRHWDARRCLDRLEAEHAKGATWDELDRLEAEQHPASFSLALTVARGHVLDHEPREALPLLNRAQVLAPRHPYPHLATARVLRLLGAEQQALIEYRLAMSADWDGQARSIFSEVARRYEGTAALRRLVPIERPEAAASYSLWLYELGDPRAADLAELASELAPDFPATPVAVALAASQSGDSGAATAAILAAWRQPDLPPALRLPLARAMGSAGQPARQIELLTDLVERPGPASPLAWLLLGRAEALHGEPGRARAALRRARKIGRADMIGRAWSIEARMERALGHRRRALMLSSRAIEGPDPGPDSLLLAAELRLEAGDTAGATQLGERALARDPSLSGVQELLRRAEGPQEHQGGQGKP